MVSFTNSDITRFNKHRFLNLETALPAIKRTVMFRYNGYTVSGTIKDSLNNEVFTIGRTKYHRNEIVGNIYNFYTGQIM
jgi:hypothetical protein